MNGSDTTKPRDVGPTEPRGRADLFRLLLAGHSELARRASPATTASLTARVAGLLTDFRWARARVESEGRDQSDRATGAFRTLLSRFAVARERRRVQQEAAADDFNLLGVLQLTHNEVRHSMVLAWLLDHDMDRLGTHAQGSLGFRMFLDEFGLPSHYADGSYRVRREVGGDESIVDVEVAARGRFLIHVENKVRSAEGIDQTDREWADVRRRAVILGLDPDGTGAPVHAMYLTPSGAKPINPNFAPVSWQRVVRVLEAFAGQAKPPEVRLFARHYADAVRRYVLTHGTTQGSHDDVEPTA